MSIIVWELTVQDTVTEKMYRTSYNFDHAHIADEIETAVDNCGGIEEALTSQILEEVDGGMIRNYLLNHHHPPY